MTEQEDLDPRIQELLAQLTTEIASSNAAPDRETYSGHVELTSEKSHLVVSMTLGTTMVACKAGKTWQSWEEPVYDSNGNQIGTIKKQGCR